MSPMSDYAKINRWLGEAWLCPDCGKVLRKPPLIYDGDRLHSFRCPTAMERVRIDWPSS